MCCSTALWERQGLGQGEGRGGEASGCWGMERTGKGSRAFGFSFPIPEEQRGRAPVQLHSETEMSLNKQQYPTFPDLQTKQPRLKKGLVYFRTSLVFRLSGIWF